MEKSYCEVRKNEPINWFNELRRTDLTNDNWEDLNDLANDWVTCACGNQCSIIPRDKHGMPIDEELRDLGFLFNEAVSNQDSEEALEILEQIEVRSAYLIDELSK